VVGAYWSLHFEEQGLWRDKGFMELHSTSTLDTRGNNLTSNTLVRKRVMCQLEKQQKYLECSSACQKDTKSRKCNNGIKKKIIPKENL
jgi:hypothetical protein